ncbi:indigoidine synthase A-like protein [Fomitopsis serialis]|uniref:indigoidine synthase A-like protein n=1 Tax=Fomitopsis serialis TaxID=139415 RepID=UPI0020075A39|nr:indigoidine synthase A-like protein [Neoantrodia serialis]KAH9937007.1 indigoidine synthase A-like protein [Neoantrodia serialis]
MKRISIRRTQPRWRTGPKRTFATLEVLRNTGPVDIHPEIQDALATKKPVVALETTIVTHGMPQPVNLQTAQSVENVVRSTGAVPATIGIIEGRVKIGLEPRELEYLADVKNNPSIAKISRRDIGPAIAQKRDGGTTCSATLIFAALAGIKVFATGGLGGVHRGGEQSMDVSADLHELTRCPVGLVSAGVKSILDIGRTLEYLETLGVPVLSYGDTNDFPAFYSRRSGFKSPWRIDDPITAARVLFTQDHLGMKNGVLFGVPIPEQYQAIGEKLQESVEQAVRESEENGVSKLGKEATPWLLKRVGELTAGRSLTSNVALIENTALIGGQIAVAYAELASQEPRQTSEKLYPSLIPQPTAPVEIKSQNSLTPEAALAIFGCAAVDITAQADPSIANTSIAVHSTVPGSISLTLGGVARNLAEAAHRVLESQSPDSAKSVVLVSAVGCDAFGRLLVNETESMGMRTDGLVTLDGARSAICNMVLDSTGGLTTGVADTDITLSLDREATREALRKHRPRLVAIDGNLSPETVTTLVDACHQDDIATFYEPTSVPKSINIFPAIAASLGHADTTSSAISYAAPNILELARMYEEAVAGKLELTAHSHWWKVVDDMAVGSEFRMDLQQLARLDACTHDRAKGTLSFLVDKGIAQMAIHLLPFFQHLIIKCGDRGVITVFRITGEQAKSSSWMQERTNVHKRCVVGKSREGAGVTVLKHYPALIVPSEKIVNVTGAGDSFVGTTLATLVHKPTVFHDPDSLDELMAQAQKAAVLTLQSQHAVSPLLSKLYRTHLPELM